jgi:hypothetical protein
VIAASWRLGSESNASSIYLIKQCF